MSDDKRESDKKKSSILSKEGEKPKYSAQDLEILLYDTEIQDLLGGEDFSPNNGIIIADMGSAGCCMDK